MIWSTDGQSSCLNMLESLNFDQSTARHIHVTTGSQLISNRIIEKKKRTDDEFQAL